jgi:protein arginine kinase activator
MNFDLNVKDFISGLFTEMVKVGKKEQNNLKIICSECGTTFEEFTKTGKLGCSKCYNTFKNKLVVLLKKIQGNIKHNGKVPKRTGGEIKRKREIESLEAEMSQEILKQNFEKAAIIRDKLKEIRKEEN